MSGLGPPFGRRAFLASGVGLSAGVAAADALDAHAAEGTVDVQRRTGSVVAATATSSSLRAASLTVNGLVDPVGVDPDDCSFAWTLTAASRGAVQTGYRVVVRRTDPGHRGLTWDSGPITGARQAFVAYTGPSLAGDASYEWTTR